MNKILFPAPHPTYDSQSFPGELLWIPGPSQKKRTGGTSSEVVGSADSIPCLFKAYKSSMTYIIYCHGNACDIGDMNYELGKYQEAFEANVLAMEYEGYGIHVGQASPAACNRDLKHVYDYLTHELHVPSQNVIVFGRSIGTGPAIFLAAQLSAEGKTIGALILQSSYLSVQDIAKKFVGVFGYLVPESFSSKKTIKQVTCPTFFIHGKMDDLIPYQHSEKLYELCICTKELYLVENASHNTWRLKNDILLPIKKFLDTYYKPIEYTVKKFPHEIFYPPTEVEVGQVQNRGFMSSLKAPFAWSRAKLSRSNPEDEE